MNKFTDRLAAPRATYLCGLSPFVFTFVSLLLVFSAGNIASADQLYGYKSANGSVTFTTRKPEGRRYWTVKRKYPRRSHILSASGSSRTPYRSLAGRQSKYDHIIKKLARKHSLEPALVKAVVHAESAFNPKARSNKGAMGLMQLMPGTAKRFGVYNAYLPHENIIGGVRYLEWLFKEFNGNISFVLAGYNAGEGAVMRYNGIPPYRETRNYVRKVKQLLNHYRCDYSGRKRCGT